MARGKGIIVGNEAVSTGKGTVLGRGCMVAFFFIFFAAGCGFLFPIFILPTMSVLDAQNWVETPCTVVSSKLESHQGEDGTTYSPKIVFEYSYKGHEYQSDQYRFFDVATGSYGANKKVVDAHPPGKQLTGYVNPNKPSEAVIVRGFTWGMLFCFLPGVFILVGLGGMLWSGGIIGKGKGRFRGNADAVDWRPDPLSESAGDDRYGDFRSVTSDAGPVTLKAASSPTAAFIGGIVVALFWNGIVSVFVWHVIHDFQWFLALFLTPFVLIGLGLIGFVFYSFLGMFNPRPQLTLSNGELHLGDQADLKWQFSGQSSSIRQLKITLTGKEEAEYRRGTSTYTDTEKFCEQPIFDGNNFVDIANGSGRVVIPRDTMHSFESSHNRIKWSIDVHGDIARWPDVKLSFPIVVQPLAKHK